MADRKVEWSLGVRWSNFAKGVQHAERDLDRLGRKTTGFSKVSEAAAKREGQNAAILEWRNRRAAAATEQLATANDKVARSYNPLNKVLAAHHKLQQRHVDQMGRVLAARQREVDQNALVVQARDAEAKSLASLEKAQNRLVVVTKRVAEIKNDSKKSDVQKAMAEQALANAMDTVTSAQGRYADSQKRTTVVVEKATREVHRNRTAWGLWRKDTEGGLTKFKKTASGVFGGLIKTLLKFGTIGAVAVPVVLGLVSAVTQLAGGAYAMVSALGPAVGILATIPQLGLGAAAAMGTLVLGFGGLGDVLKASTKAEDELTEAQAKARAEMSASERAAFDYQRALAGLPKETQSFAKYLVSLKPKLKELRNASAKGLMPGAEKGLRSIMKLFPTVKKSVGDMGKVFGDSFARFGKALAAPKAQGEFKRVMASNTVVAGTFARSMERVGLFMLSLADSARGLTEWIAKGTEAWIKNSVASFEAAKKAGKVKKFFEETKDVLKILGNTFKNIAVGLKNIGVVGYDSGKGLAESFEDATAKFKAWTEQDATKSKMATFFRESKDTVESIGRILKDISIIIGGLGMPSGATEEVPQSSTYSSQVPGSAPKQTRPMKSPGAALIAGLEDMMPTIQSIVQTLSENMGTGVIDAIKSLLEAFDAFLQNGGAEALGTFSDVLATIADVIKTIVEIPGAAATIAAIAAAFGGFKAFKVVSKWLGITSLGKAIKTFYIDSKRPKGWTPPPTGAGMGGGGFYPTGGGAAPQQKKPHWWSRKPPAAPAAIPVGFAPTPSPVQEKKPRWWSRTPPAAPASVGFGPTPTATPQTRKPRWFSRGPAPAPAPIPMYPPEKPARGGGGGWFPGWGGGGRRPAITPTTVRTTPTRRRFPGFGRGPAPAPVPMGFGPAPRPAAKPQGFLGGLFGRKKPTPGAPKRPSRFAGFGGGLSRTTNRVGAAAGALWLGTQFLDPESEMGEKAGNLSSVLSAAMFLPMLTDTFGGVGSGAKKIGRGVKKVTTRRPRPIGPKPQSRLSKIGGGIKRVAGGAKTKVAAGASKVGGAVKSAGGAVGKGATSAVRGIGEAAGKAKTKLAPLVTTVAQFGSMIGGKVLEGLSRFGGWLKTIPGSISKFAGSLGKGLMGALGKIGGFLGKMAGSFMSLATKVLPMVGRAFMVLGRAMFMNPFGLIVLAIIGLIAAFVALYKNNEGFRKFVQQVWAKIKEAIGAVVDWLVNTAWPWLQGVFKRIGEVIGWLWTNIVKPYFQFIWGIVKAVFGWILNTGWPLLQRAFNFIGKIIGWLWKTIVKPYFQFIWNIVKTVFNWILETGWPLVQRAFKFIGDAIGAVVGVFQTVFDTISRIWNGLVEAVSKPIRIVVDWINRNFIGKINQLLGKLGLSFRLPIIPGGTAQIAQDQRAATSTKWDRGQTKAEGGTITGHSPTPTADNIPAWLTAGEFVTRVKSVRRMRKEFPGYLEHINKFGRPPERHAVGGAVGVSGRRERWFKRQGQYSGVKVDAKQAVERHAAGGYVGKPSLAHAFAPKFGLGGLIADAWNFFKDVGGFVKGKVNDLLDKFGLKEFLRNLVGGVGGKALRSMADWAREKMLGFFGEGGDNGNHRPRGYNTVARVKALIASSGLKGLSFSNTYRNPAQNKAAGGVPNSLHMDAANPAVDIVGTDAVLNQFYGLLRAAGGWAELLWQVPNHYDHIHVAAQGGLVPSKGVMKFAKGGVVPRADAHGGLTFDPVQRFHAGGPVNGMKYGGTGDWVRGLYRMLLLDSDATRWSSDLTTRLRSFYGGTPVQPSTRSRDIWASRLKSWATRNRTKSMSSLSAYLNASNAGYMNYQRLIWLSTVRPDAWKAVTASKAASSVWLEQRRNAENKERGDLLYALQKQAGFGREGTTLDRSISGPAEWESIQHAMMHGLSWAHSDYLARPWAPRSAAELAVRAQQDANNLQAQFNKYLDVFALWGLGDLIDNLLGMGIEEGLPLARSFAGNRKAATDYDAALKAGKQLVSTSSPEALKFISTVSSSTEPLGIRALARAVGLPDFGVVQMYEELLAAKRLVKGPQTARLDREVPMFKAGLFYASGGGKVPGQGSRDTVPAMLTPGEFVLRKAAVKAIGMENVRALNNLRFYANGGPVFPVTPATPALPVGTMTAIRRGVPEKVATNTINIRTNIFNPVRETSTASMHRMLRQQAAQGVFGQDMRNATVVMVKPEGS